MIPIILNNFPHVYEFPIFDSHSPVELSSLGFTRITTSSPAFPNNQDLRQGERDITNLPAKIGVMT
ncbi:hypothetical protein BC826DRAFT_392026 [Russula brevipes]|nr:hypothetical protein BC826DRAFT_392026 [Russula brevipes]